MLQLIDIHTYYGEGHVLHGVSMTVQKGSVVALMGRNGMGKTTTIRSIIGFTPPRDGKIYFKDLGNYPFQAFPYRKNGDRTWCRRDETFFPL